MCHMDPNSIVAVQICDNFHAELCHLTSKKYQMHFIILAKKKKKTWHSFGKKYKSLYLYGYFIMLALESVTSKAILCSSSELEKNVNPSTHISQLPTEIILRLFHYLGPEDLCRCSQVCSSWSELAKTGSLWRHLYPVRWARGKLLIAGALIKLNCGGSLLINVFVSLM